MTDTRDAILLKGLTKSFGSKVAVRDLDLTVPRGGLYGLIGPNGAGKTTTIRMILSILFPDAGEISVLGRRSALEAKDRIGYLPEERGLYRKMRVGAFLTYLARLKGLEGDGVRSKVHGWLERTGLVETEGKRCEELSKGMQQKLQFIAAIVHEPDLLILDEPFSGLDPVNMRLLRDLVLEQHRRGATVLFSTHVMSQAEQICERIVMIHDGVKVLDGSLAEIQARHDPRSILLETRDGGADLAAVGALPGVRSVSRDGGVWEIALAPGADPSGTLRDVAAAVPALRLELRRPTLEDIFVEIVTGGETESAETAARLRAALATGAPVVRPGAAA